MRLAILLTLWLVASLQTVNLQAQTVINLSPSDPWFMNYFGSALASSGDYVLVGASGYEVDFDRIGAVYVFKRDGQSWTEEAILTASDGADGYGFGAVIAMNQDYAFIGAPSDGDSGEDAGSVYVFKREGSSWIEEEKLTASDAEARDEFGSSVSVFGDYLLIGARRGDQGDTIDNGSGTGAAYVFKLDGTTWVEHQKLVASDGIYQDDFGITVSMHGDYAFIGATGDNNEEVENDFDSGSVYVFKLEGERWVEHAHLRASDGERDDEFGGAIALSEDYAIIGASRDNIGEDGDTGSAYVFKREGTEWVQQDKLVDFERFFDERFGSEVAINGDFALVGAPRDGEMGSKAGAVFLYKRDGDTWGVQAKLSNPNGTPFEQFGTSVLLNDEYVIVGEPWLSGSGATVFMYLFDTIELDPELPVELISFKAVVSGENLTLSWATGSELNNAGFAIEVRKQEHVFEQVKYVEGHGTTNVTQYYETTLSGISPGEYSVRLKQIDFDGTFAYSKSLRVIVDATEYTLAQSYPNPFNPQTHIQYSLPIQSHVQLTVFDLLGRPVQTLVDDTQDADTYSVLFDAEGLPNGTYVYRLTAGGYTETRTMVLLK